MKALKWIIKGILILFFIAFIIVSISLPSLGKLPKNSDDAFRIGLANLNSDNKKAKEISERIIGLECDTIIGLEWTGNNLILSTLENSGYITILNRLKKGTHGICILSRNNLNTRAQIMQSPIKGPCEIPIGIVQITNGKMDIAILGIHVPPPIAACKNTTDTTLKAISNWINNGKLSEDKGIAKKGDLAILAGDMNIISFQASYKYMVSSGLIDSYSRFNWRPGPTWSPFSWLPAIIRIDYIFVSSKLKILNSWTVNLPGSDHRGIVTDIKFSS